MYGRITIGHDVEASVRCWRSEKVGKHAVEITFGAEPGLEIAMWEKDPIAFLEKLKAECSRVQDELCQEAEKAKEEAEKCNASTS